MLGVKFWVNVKLKVLLVQTNSTLVMVNRVIWNKNAFRWDAYRPLVDHSRGVPARGVPARGVPAQGGVCPRGCLPKGWVACPGVPAQGVCLPRGCLSRGVSAWGGVCLGHVPCDLSHHAFDVTCMLSCHQLRLITSAAAYIVFGHVTCGACWNTTNTPTPPLWTEWQTRVKT